MSTMTECGRIDVHQHLWTPELLLALRERSRPPYVRGWTLHVDGEPDYDIDPAAHEPSVRAALDHGVDRIVLSLSSPLGLEGLAPVYAQPLLAAWHTGARQLPAPYTAWAAVCLLDPDLDGLVALLDTGLAGLQIPATALLTPAAVEALAPVLRVCENANRPVFVHPGPVLNNQELSATQRDHLPSWWPAVVDYPAQLQAAWWAWQVAGRSQLPELRLCFAAGGGLAATHQERYLARGGRGSAVDRNVFLDTSSYGPRAIDALIRVLGIDVIVNGSDRPYAEPSALPGGDAAARAITVINPLRLLEGVPS